MTPVAKARDSGEHGAEDQVKHASEKGAGGRVVMGPGSMEERSLDKTKTKNRFSSLRQKSKTRIIFLSVQYQYLI